MLWIPSIPPRAANAVASVAVKYLNLPIEDLENYSMWSIIKNEPVWFGTDVSNYMHNELNILDDDIFDFSALFGTEFGILEKGERMVYGGETMNHAMVLSKVRYVKDDENKECSECKGKECEHFNCKIEQWKVVNSWGQNGLQKGVYDMTNSYFKNHVYQVVINKNLLSKEHLEIYKGKTNKTLPLWDPMGSLALI